MSNCSPVVPGATSSPVNDMMVPHWAWVTLLKLNDGAWQSLVTLIAVEVPTRPKMVWRAVTLSAEPSLCVGRLTFGEENVARPT